MAPGCFSAGVLIAAAGWAFHQFLSVSRRHLAALHSVLSPRDRIGSSLCENSARYKRTLNFEACGRAESKKTRKSVLRWALRPNQIKFSHSLGPNEPRRQRGAAAGLPR